MDALKYLTVIIMVGMVAKALWTLAAIGRQVVRDREPK